MQKLENEMKKEKLYRLVPTIQAHSIPSQYMYGAQRALPYSPQHILYLALSCGFPCPWKKKKKKKRVKIIRDDNINNNEIT